MTKIGYLGILSGLTMIAGCSNAEQDTNARQPSSESLEQNAAIFQYDSGLSVGDRVPLDIAVKVDGKATNLAKLLEDGPIVLFFVRSVEWCGFCQAQLKAVEQIIPDLESRGYRPIAVSYDPTDVQSKFLVDQKLNITLLSDESSSLIDGFELRDPQFTQGRAEGVPYAAVMVIGQTGRILNKTISGNHTVRPRNQQILNLVDAI
ncbi:MAG: redoxin domain-containing protein [Parasphingorhabdus sp.]|uniref:redoxin domain-containing protein n=1 Tax=Parasphingorhabdus sp. TaxID=2709688 RepID=UPI00329961E4